MRSCCPSAQVASYPDLNGLQEATEDELRAYERKLRLILDRSDELMGEALESAIRLIREMQERLLGRLAKAVGTGKFDAFWLPWLERAVQEVAEQLAERYQVDVGKLLPKAWTLGVEQADSAPDAPTEPEPFPGERVGRIGATPLPHISPDDVGIAAQFTPDLIRGLEEETVKIVGRELALSVLSGEAPSKTMERLATELGDPGPWTSVAYRAEIVTRTETARIQDLAAQHRMEQRAALDPTEDIWWTILVAEVNGWPCPTCTKVAEHGPFRVGDPHAPTLPIHPNCRCKRIRHFPNWEPAKGINQTDEQRAAGLTDSENEQPADATAGIPPEEEAGFEEKRRLQTVSELTTNKDRVRWTRKNVGMQPLTDEERAALAWYAYDGHTVINPHLRGQPVDPTEVERAKAAVEHLDRAIQKSKLREGVITFRALGSRRGPLADIEPGATIPGEAYPSTTLDREHATGRLRRYLDAPDGVGYLASIALPKGMNALPVEKALAEDTPYPGEHELLLSRHISFRVVSVTPDPVTPRLNHVILEPVL